MADRHLANPSLLGAPASLRTWARASVQYRLINHHRDDQALVSARLTLTEARLRAAGIPDPRR